MADYFAHWLKIGKQADATKLPKIFFVNWFRRDEDGRYIWPGFGENSSVLKWVFERVDGKSAVDRTAIGLLPAAGALDTTALDVPQDDLDTLLSVDVDGWLAAVPQIREHFERFGENIPAELSAALATLEHQLTA
jgi:phosphoenolpyruvate carboxykinase (GTP)